MTEQNHTLAELLMLDSIDSSLIIRALKQHAETGSHLMAEDVMKAIDKANLDNTNLSDAYMHLGSGFRVSHSRGYEHAYEYRRAMSDVASRMNFFEF